MSALRRLTTVDEVRTAFDKFFSEEGIKKGLAFKPRPSDVVISPHAKCGTTWLQQIVHGLRTRGSMDFDEITVVTPWLEMAYNVGWDLEAPQMAEPRVYKSHLNWHDVPKGARYVWSARHPYHVLVSMYRFLEDWWFEPDSISIETFARELFTADYHNRGYWNHLLSWWEQRDNPDVLLLCYENMEADLPATVRTVARFVGVPLDDELLEIVVHQSTREFMLGHVTQFDDHIVRAYAESRCGLAPNGDSSKVTPGPTDAARYRLSPALLDELDAIWKEMIEPKFGFRDYADLRAAMGPLQRG